MSATNLRTNSTLMLVQTSLSGGKELLRSSEGDGIDPSCQAAAALKSGKQPRKASNPHNKKLKPPSNSKPHKSTSSGRSSAVRKNKADKEAIRATQSGGLLLVDKRKKNALRKGDRAKPNIFHRKKYAEQHHDLVKSRSSDSDLLASSLSVAMSTSESSLRAKSSRKNEDLIQQRHKQNLFSSSSEQATETTNKLERLKEDAKAGEGKERGNNNTVGTASGKLRRSLSKEVEKQLLLENLAGWLDTALQMKNYNSKVGSGDLHSPQTHEGGLQAPDGGPVQFNDYLDDDDEDDAKEQMEKEEQKTNTSGTLTFVDSPVLRALKLEDGLDRRSNHEGNGNTRPRRNTISSESPSSFDFAEGGPPDLSIIMNSGNEEEGEHYKKKKNKKHKQKKKNKEKEANNDNSGKNKKKDRKKRRSLTISLKKKRRSTDANGLVVDLDALQEAALCEEQGEKENGQEEAQRGLDINQNETHKKKKRRSTDNTSFMVNLNELEEVAVREDENEKEARQPPTRPRRNTVSSERQWCGEHQQEEDEEGRKDVSHEQQRQKGEAPVVIETS
ncbi:hypothetical protein QOT17_010354 [Balamuthia mandrillaris]